MRIEPNLYGVAQITNNLCSGVSRHYERLYIFLEFRVAAQNRMVQRGRGKAEERQIEKKTGGSKVKGTMFALLLCILITTQFVHPSIIFPVKYLGLCLFVSALSIPAASQFHGDIIMLIIIIIPSMTIVPTTRWHGDACVYAPVRHYCTAASGSALRSDPRTRINCSLCPTAVAGNFRLLTTKATLCLLINYQSTMEVVINVSKTTIGNPEGKKQILQNQKACGLESSDFLSKSHLGRPRSR